MSKILSEFVFETHYFWYFFVGLTKQNEKNFYEK